MDTEDRRSGFGIFRKFSIAEMSYTGKVKCVGRVTNEEVLANERERRFPGTHIR